MNLFFFIFFIDKCCIRLNCSIYLWLHIEFSLIFRDHKKLCSHCMSCTNYYYIFCSLTSFTHFSLILFSFLYFIFMLLNSFANIIHLVSLHACKHTDRVCSKRATIFCSFFGIATRAILQCLRYGLSFIA